MQIEKCVKSSFSVIGKEGSTELGDGFVQQLWVEANAHFEEVVSLAKKNDDGSFAGFWGCMTDFSRSFAPWEEGFSKGLYLAGVECLDDAEAPGGWVKWTVPGFEYLCVLCDGSDVFAQMLSYLKEQGLALAGAVQDYTCPQTGSNYMYFPIKRLSE